jgi:hypothetical protein
MRTAARGAGAWNTEAGARNEEDATAVVAAMRSPRMISRCRYISIAIACRGGSHQRERKYGTVFKGNGKSASK